MSSSFVYHPHVHRSDGTVITPDIAVDRVFVSGPAGLEAAPVSRLTSAAALQQSADAPVGTPAVVLLAASYGLLVSVGAIIDDLLAVSRAAWRHDDIERGYDDIDLRSWTVREQKRTPVLSQKLGALLPTADAMGALGNSSGLKPGTAVFIRPAAPLGESVAADRIEVALEAGENRIHHAIDIEPIG